MTLRDYIRSLLTAELDRFARLEALALRNGGETYAAFYAERQREILAELSRR